jgi:hypothetical protein
VVHAAREEACWAVARQLTGEIAAEFGVTDADRKWQHRCSGWTRIPEGVWRDRGVFAVLVSARTLASYCLKLLRMMSGILSLAVGHAALSGRDLARSRMWPLARPNLTLILLSAVV